MILVVALLILGPNRIPQIARKMGHAYRILRRTTQDFTTAISREINLQEGESSSLPNPPPDVQKNQELQPEPRPKTKKPQPQRARKAAAK